MKRPYVVQIVIFTVICSNVCGESAGEAANPWLESNWPQADQLFQRDRHWVGGDGAYSIDLSEGRVLWLFGDSWIDASGTGSRTGATMVSNTVAIQQGYDPSDATIRFFGEARSLTLGRSFRTPKECATGQDMVFCMVTDSFFF